MTSPAPKSYLSLYLSAGIIAVTVILYLDGLLTPFVLDDFRGILWRRSITEGGIRDIFSDIPNRILPLYLYKLLLKLFGPAPYSFHLIALFFHAVNSAMIFLLIRQIFNKVIPAGSGENITGIWPALAGAVFFAISPMQSQAVLYAWQAQTVIAAFFALAALNLFVYGISKADPPLKIPTVFLLGSFALFLCAGFSKPNTVTTAIIAATLIGFKWVSAKESKYLVRALAPWAAAAFLISLPVLLIETQETIDIKAAADTGTLLDPLSYLRTQVYVIARYLQMTLMLQGFSIDHDVVPVSGFIDLRLYAGLLTHTTLGVIALVSRKRAPAIMIGILIFYAAHLIESSVLPLEDLMFDHRMYFPFLGLSVAIAGLTDLVIRLSVKPVFRNFMIIAGILYLATNYHATNDRISTWSTRASLWKDAAIKAPAKKRPWSNWGLALVEEGNNDLAITVLQNAEKLKGKPDSRLYDALGTATAGTGRSEQAEIFFKKGLDINPDDVFLWKSYGVFLANSTRYEEAVAAFDRVLTEHSNDVHIQQMRLAAEMQFAAYQSVKPKIIASLSNQPPQLVFIRNYLLTTLKNQDRSFFQDIFEQTRDLIIQSECGTNKNCSFLTCLIALYSPNKKFNDVSDSDLISCFSE